MGQSRKHKGAGFLSALFVCLFVGVLVLLAMGGKKPKASFPTVTKSLLLKPS